MRVCGSFALTVADADFFLITTTITLTPIPIKTTIDDRDELPSYSAEWKITIKVYVK